jgi:DNA-binding NarL/FixJ family response regulator
MIATLTFKKERNHTRAAIMDERQKAVLDYLESVKCKVAKTEVLSLGEMLSAYPDFMMEKLLENNSRIYQQIGEKAARTEAICRLLAAGMTADEIITVLKYKPWDVEEAQAANREKIETYARQLKARRVAKKKRDHLARRG